MYNLNQFLDFRASDFFRDKKLEYLGKSNWTHHQTGALLGTRVDLVIIEDNTQYEARSDDKPIRSNRFEKIRVKIPGPVSEVSENALVELVNPVCRVWGDYNSQLSIVADDVREIVPASVAKPATKPPMPKL